MTPAPRISRIKSGTKGVRGGLLTEVAGRHLPPLERRLLRDLIDQGSCSFARLIDQLWADDPNGGPVCARRLVHLYVHRLRPALRPQWDIVNERGWGYRLAWRELTETRSAA